MAKIVLSLLKARSSIHQRRSNARQQAEILSSIGSAGCQLKVRPDSDTCRADLSPETVASLTTQQMLCRDPVVSVMKTPTCGMATILPVADVETARETGVSLGSTKCVRDRS
jgi:hypothetical protein